MTPEHEATRTLVKSPPELWAECSDAGSLARHLGEFGEIRITRLEPETTVAWEGEHVSGTVRIEPSAWGTRVTLTAQPKREEAEETPEVADEPSVEQADAAERPSADADADAQPADEVAEATEQEDAPTAPTPEDPDPIATSDSPTLRIRWRRMTDRMRGAFRRPTPEEPGSAGSEPSGQPEVPVAEDMPAAPEEPIAAEPVQSSRSEPDREPDPGPAPDLDPETVAESTGGSQGDAEAILAAALESLGQAHHRPFSRA
jgi:hypothetical protein